MSRIRTGPKPDDWHDQGPSAAAVKVRVGGPAVAGYRIVAASPTEIARMRAVLYNGKAPGPS
jgi:hypothetical protein